MNLASIAGQACPRYVLIRVKSIKQPITIPVAMKDSLL
jgi:hypothetical protein